MAQRRLIIERPTSSPRQAPASVCVEVRDDQSIGPVVSTVAAHFGYPLSDSFGSPIRYRLRSLPEGTFLPSTGRFAQVRCRSGSHFVLEAEGSAYATMPLPQEFGGATSPHEASSPAQMSRRSLLTTGGTLALVSMLGLFGGMTTAVAQQALRTPVSTASPPNRSAQGTGPLQLSLQSTFTGHQRTVRTLAWSPDGKTLASGGDDALLLLWRPDGSILSTHPFAHPVHGVAWSPDGGQLAVGSGRAVVFVDARTATPLAEDARAHLAPVTALGWTQTSPTLCVSAGEDTQAVVWNGQTHQPQGIFGQHTAPLLALSTLFDLVATASEGGIIRLWSALSGRAVHGYFSETEQAIRALAFASTGMLAAGCDDGIVRIWKESKTCSRAAPSAFGLRCLDVPTHLRGHTARVRAVAFSPDGTLFATGGDDGRVMLWQSASLLPVLTQMLPEAIAALAWSPSGSFLAIASGQKVTLWHLHH